MFHCQLLSDTLSYNCKVGFPQESSAQRQKQQAEMFNVDVKVGQSKAKAFVATIS